MIIIIIVSSMSVINVMTFPYEYMYINYNIVNCYSHGLHAICSI